MANVSACVNANVNVNVHVHTILIGVFEVRVNVHLGVIVTESVPPGTHAHGNRIIMSPVVRFVGAAQTVIQSRQVDVARKSTPFFKMPSWCLEAHERSTTRDLES